MTTREQIIAAAEEVKANNDMFGDARKQMGSPAPSGHDCEGAGVTISTQIGI